VIASTATRRAQSIDELISPELCSRLDRIDILSRKVFAGKLQGERRSKRRGQSVEFEDYRNYVPGDDLRHVDWNVFARLERFFIKVFLEEEDLSFHLVIDASASMQAGTPEKLLLAQRLAMCLGYIALVNNDRVAVSVHDGRELRALAPMRGRRNVQRVAGFLLKEVRPAGSEEELGRARGVSEPDFTSAMRTIAMTRRGKGVMVVLSDFLIREGYQDGLRYLAGHGGAGRGSGGSGGGGYDVFCLQVLSPGEIDPALEGAGEGEAAGPVVMGDLKLTDVETGRGAEVTVTSALLKRYRATVNKYMDDLRAFCTARGMSYGLVRSDADLQTLLLEYLRRRGLLR
jgi:hypothetical protein